MFRNGRVELLQEQLKDRTTKTAELKLVIVGPPSAVPYTPPHPITWIPATTLHCLSNKRCFEVMLLFFVPTTAREQRENRTTQDKGDLRAAYNERTSIIKENTCHYWRNHYGEVQINQRLKGVILLVILPGLQITRWGRTKSNLWTFVIKLGNFIDDNMAELKAAPPFIFIAPRILCGGLELQTLPHEKVRSCQTRVPLPRPKPRWLANTKGQNWFYVKQDRLNPRQGSPASPPPVALMHREQLGKDSEILTRYLCFSEWISQIMYHSKQLQSVFCMMWFPPWTSEGS